MAGAGRGCGREGWGPSQCCWFCWSIVQGKYPGWRGEGHRWSLRQCSVSVVGSFGQQHCSSHTRQWCRWSAHSQWCPCRMWWGWVERDLPFSVGGRKCRRWCPFLLSDVTLVVQMRTSVMCTPRNLVLPTLSTVEPSMVSGGWSTEFLLKSITTSFVLLTLRDRLFAPHHSASCATFCFT